MPSFNDHWFYEFVTLLVVLDPIATVPLYVMATAGLSAREARKVAFYALGTAFAVLVAFIAVGQLLLEAMHIPMASFQLAGSLLFLILGVQMATGNMHSEQNGHAVSASSLWGRSIYPLATPGIAGGGGMLTVVLLTDNRTRSVGEQLTTIGVLASCLVVHLASFLAAKSVMRWLRPEGIQIISRVFGLILTSVAIHGIVTAIKISFGL